MFGLSARCSDCLSTDHPRPCMMSTICSPNVVLTLGLRCKHWPTINTPFRQHAELMTGLSHSSHNIKQTRKVDPMAVKCWAIVADSGPTLHHHCVNVYTGHTNKYTVNKRHQSNVAGPTLNQHFDLCLCLLGESLRVLGWTDWLLSVLHNKWPVSINRFILLVTIYFLSTMQKHVLNTCVCKQNNFIDK